MMYVHAHTQICIASSFVGSPNWEQPKSIISRKPTQIYKCTEIAILQNSEKEWTMGRYMAEFQEIMLSERISKQKSVV